MKSTSSSHLTFFSVLIDFCHKSKNLYNHANYLIRQAFTSENNWIRYAELDRMLKADKEYPDYQNMPTAQSAQQILRSLKKIGNHSLPVSKTGASTKKNMQESPDCRSI
ncbi:MAG: hypothetical protein K2H89_03390 [Oscillospiraceae bacterium]|nr:hypothetical protein [Oscillospiraceae bacterium]